MPTLSNEATALIEAVRTFLILATTFGIAISAEQQQAIIIFIGAAAAAVSAILAYVNRNKVFSEQTTQRIANAATFEKPGSVVDIGSPPSGNTE